MPKPTQEEMLRLMERSPENWLEFRHLAKTYPNEPVAENYLRLCLQPDYADRSGYLASRPTGFRPSQARDECYEAAPPRQQIGAPRYVTQDKKLQEVWEILRESESLSVSDIQTYTGLNYRAVKTALLSLVNAGYVQAFGTSKRYTRYALVMDCGPLCPAIGRK